MENTKSNMQLLTKAMKWDFFLQKRYHILTIALVVSIFYSVCWQFVGDSFPDEVLILLIFSDPAMLGFLFIGVLVLTEKGSNTLQALVVSPLSTAEYIWSKAITLTAIAVVCSLIIALSTHGFALNYLYLVLGVLFSSLLFIFVGFIAAARVKDFNEYVFVLPFFMIPLCVPFLNFFGVTDISLFYLIPTQASLVLLEAAFKGVISLPMLAYALICLTVWTIIAYVIAKIFYQKYLIEKRYA